MCEDCEDYMLQDDAYSCHGRMICQSCYDDSYFTCHDCGDIEHTDDCNYCDGCNNSYCSSCACSCNDNREIDLNEHASNLRYNGSDAIADYHPEVNWEFKTNKLDDKNAPFFGVELEIECKDKNLSAKTVGKLLAGHAIATYDGSLNNGFEIVFTPHKYQAFRKLNFKHILKELSKTRATSHDSGTCGLHVHIEKKDWFNNKMFYGGDCYYNSDLYQKFYNMLSDDITKLSRRTQDQISNFCSFQRSRGSRYSAVNLTPDNTVEVRIWRGTLNPKRFKANLQFTLAVYYFLQQHSKTLLFQDADKLKSIFKDWLQVQPEYSCLVKYCKDKKLFGFTHRKQSRLPIVVIPQAKPSTDNLLAILASNSSTLRQSMSDNQLNDLGLTR